MSSFFGSKKQQNGTEMTGGEVEGQMESAKDKLNNDQLLTEEIIISNKWMLHYSPIRHKREIQFKAGGKIGKGQNDWEYNWLFIKPGVFATYTKSNDPDVIFTAHIGYDNKWYLSGGAHTITQQ